MKSSLIHTVLLIIILITLGVSLSAQTLENLEAQRLNIIRDIEETKELLKTYKTNKASNIKRLNTLEIQVENSENLIKTLQKEIELISKQDIDTTQSNNTNNTYYKTLLSEAYKQKFAEPDNKKAHHIREIYLTQVSSHFGNSFSSDSTTILLAQKEEMLNTEAFNLTNLKNKVDSLSLTLKETIVSQSQLEKTYSQKVSERKKLNDKIQSLLFNNFNNQTSTYSQTGSSFENKKGFLRWPVTSGKIELRYGEQKLKDNKSLVFINSGIDIVSTDKSVFGIYPGEIITVSNISADNITMIIKHTDDYYTVYSNLSQNNKSKGDYINEGDLIGLMNKNAKGVYQIHLEIWQSRENLNPYHWLKNN